MTAHHALTAHSAPTTTMQHPLQHDRSLSVMHNIGDPDWPHPCDFVAIVRTAAETHNPSRPVPYATGALHWQDGTTEGLFTPLHPDGSPSHTARWSIPAPWFLMAFHAALSTNSGRLDNLIGINTRGLFAEAAPVPPFIDLTPHSSSLTDTTGNLQ